jgi:glycosyltransferase involved in cell wall biosynthesis
MQILYLNAFLTRYDFWTGERGRQLVDALRAGGVQVATFPERYEREESIGQSTSRRRGFLKTLAKKWFPRSLLWFAIDCYLFLQGIKRTTCWGWAIWRRRHELNPDVVLARTFEYDMTPWVVSRILNRPLILEIHSPFYIERQFRGRGNSYLFHYLERFLWRSADRLWVHTAELRKIIVANGIELERVAIIPFGVRDHKAPSLRHDVPARGTDVKVVFVGSFYQWHGISELLKAFAKAHARIDSLRLCIIGDGVTRREDERLARALGIDHLVEFTGWLPHEQVVKRLQQSDVGVAPYTKLEPFYMEPVKVLDYMTAGLAIVASAQGQICDLIQDGRSGVLVPPSDVDALANALIRLGEDRELRERLGKGAKAVAPTWERTATQVTAIGHDVLDAERKASQPVIAQL